MYLTNSDIHLPLIDRRVVPIPVLVFLAVLNLIVL